MAAIKPQASGGPAKGIKKAGAQSTFIAGWEYDENNMTLITHMKNGAIYEHKGQFSPEAWDELTTAKNPAKHWANFVKGQYASVRVKVVKAPNSEIKTGGHK